MAIRGISRSQIKSDARAFQRHVTQILGDLALAHVLPQIPSTTIRDSMQLVRIDDETVELQVQYYWARWFHDGREVVRPGHGGPGSRFNSRVLIWFENPDNDPRIGGSSRNYPVRPNDIKSMKQFPAAYERGLRENARRRKAGQRPFMIVTKFSKPFAGVPFFTSLAGLNDQVSDVIAREMDKWVRERVVSETVTAVIRL